MRPKNSKACNHTGPIGVYSPRETEERERMLVVPHPKTTSDRRLDLLRLVWKPKKAGKSKLKMRVGRAYLFSSNVMVHKEKDFLPLPYLKFNSWDVELQT